jgi:hypothetical protein
VNQIFRTSLLACWFVCCGMTSAVAQSSESQDAAERRAKAFANAISSPDHAKWQKFWADNFKVRYGPVGEIRSCGQGFSCSDVSIGRKSRKFKGIGCG